MRTSLDVAVMILDDVSANCHSTNYKKYAIDAAFDIGLVNSILKEYGGYALPLDYVYDELSGVTIWKTITVCAPCNFDQQKLYYYLKNK